MLNAIHAMSCGRAVEDGQHGRSGHDRRQALINIDSGMHDFNAHLLKFEHECVYTDRSLHQPSNERYGAMEHR